MDCLVKMVVVKTARVLSLEVVLRNDNDIQSYSAPDPITLHLAHGPHADIGNGTFSSWMEETKVAAWK